MKSPYSIDTRTFVLLAQNKRGGDSSRSEKYRCPGGIVYQPVSNEEGKQYYRINAKTDPLSTVEADARKEALYMLKAQTGIMLSNGARDKLILLESKPVDAWYKNNRQEVLHFTCRYT